MTTNDKWANTEANKRAYVNAQMLAGEQLGYLRRTNRRKRSKRLFKSLVFGKPEGSADREAWGKLAGEIYERHTHEELERLVNGPVN
jgi:hypothetical protein